METNILRKLYYNCESCGELIEIQTLYGGQTGEKLDPFEIFDTYCCGKCEGKPSKSDIEFAKQIGKDPEKIECWKCFDGEFYPQYGRAPHQSFVETTLQGKFAEDLPQNKWPDNFKPDWEGIPESERENYNGPMCGVWYCPNNCKHGGRDS